MATEFHELAFTDSVRRAQQHHHGQPRPIRKHTALPGKGVFSEKSLAQNVTCLPVLTIKCLKSRKISIPGQFAGCQSQKIKSLAGTSRAQSQVPGLYVKPLHS